MALTYWLFTFIDVEQQKIKLLSVATGVLTSEIVIPELLQTALTSSLTVIIQLVGALASFYLLQFIQKKRSLKNGNAHRSDSNKPLDHD